MKLSNLTSHLPAQATLSKIPATRTHRSVAEYASVLSIGLIAGASLALLLTPTPGKELRGRISDRVGGLRQRAKKVVAKANGRLHGAEDSLH